MLETFRDLQIKVLHLEITRTGKSDKSTMAAIFNLRLNKKCTVEQLLLILDGIKGVKSVEEL